jgi:hypothetical protein
MILQAGDAPGAVRVIASAEGVESANVELKIRENQ